MEKTIDKIIFEFEQNQKRLYPDAVFFIPLCQMYFCDYLDLQKKGYSIICDADNQFIAVFNK